MSPVELSDRRGGGGVEGVREGATTLLKVHKNENFFGFDFEICTFS